MFPFLALAKTARARCGARTLASVVQSGDRVRVLTRGLLLDDPGGELAPGETEEMEFKVGAGHTIPGFDRGVIGMAEGEATELVLAPDDAFGQREESAMVKMPLAQLPSGVSVGSQLRLSDAAQVGTIVDIERDGEDDLATIDLNHSLAGKTVRFQLTVVGITKPGESEHGDIVLEAGEAGGNGRALEGQKGGRDVAQLLPVPGQGDGCTFPLPGDTAYIHYVGWKSCTGTEDADTPKYAKYVEPRATETAVDLDDAGTTPTWTVFDDSHSTETGRVFSFCVGRGEVIAAWDEAIPMMSLGQRSTFQVPLAQAFGAKGEGRFKPPFPPAADLRFEVELVNVRRHPMNVIH